MKYQKTFKAFVFVCLCCMATILFAQKPQGDATILVKVTIVDVDKNPLPGATVKVTGKAQGVVANDQGEVSLWVDRNTQIEFKYVGMKPLFMRVTKPLSGYITLEDETSELDQVVVTGYQRTTKRRTTGSLTTLTAKDLKGAPTANLDMLMQGKVAGMDVKAVSGRPGESAKIRIRGTNTITGNAEPLWVVDGVPLQKDIPSISSSQIRAGDFNEIFANGISVFIFARRHPFYIYKQIIQSARTGKSRFLCRIKQRRMSLIQDFLSIFNTGILQELLRTNPCPLRKHTLEMCRTQRHLPGNLIQSRLPFEILPYIPDCLCNTCIIKRFLPIHNRGLPFISKSSNRFLAGRPPAYPTSVWLLPITR